MKKTLMTFVAVGFGISVAFAQTTGTDQQGQQDTEFNQQTQQGDDMYGQDDRRRVEMHELPMAVQDAFMSGEYSDWEVLAIYEMNGDDAAQGTEGVGTDTGMDQQSNYAFELAEGGQGDQTAMGEGTDDGMGGVETERVSERRADKVVVFDENGEVVKEKDADDKKDKKRDDY